MMLELDKLTAAYGQAIALENLSLQIGKGELVAILGPNGAGKSTLLKVISRALPSRGTLNFNGQSLHQYSTEQVVGQGICHCPEGRRLFPELSVIKNLQLGAYLRHDRDAVARDLERVYALFPILAERRDQIVSTLSGGQQQRVALARSLVIEPEVLLFDEPLSNLDARLRREMRQEIRNLQQRLGLTVVYVTHDQSEAMAVSDRICVMNKGQIAQQGAPRDLYDHPADAFVAGFMGEAMWVRAQGLPGGQGLQLGDWVWQDGRGHPPGELELAIRPEAWHLTDAPSGLPAQLRHCAFMGSQYELTLATALGHVLMMLPSHVQAPRIDAWVHLGLSAHGVVVLSRSS